MEAPTAVRSGLIYEVQFTVSAHRALEEPTLVLDSGWFDGFTINTMSPDTKDWAQRDGRQVLSYDAVPAGTELVVRLQYQANPTTMGTRNQGVVLEDGGTPILDARPRDDGLPVMDIVIRAAVIFVFIWVLMRVIGRRELSSMEPFDLIMLVVIGDLIQQGVTQQDLSVTGALLAAATIGLLTVLLAWLNYRFPRLRPALEGRPVVLVEDGKAIEQNLKRERITLEELAAQARLKEIDSISDVRWAVLETSGRDQLHPALESGIERGRARMGPPLRRVGGRPLVWVKRSRRGACGSGGRSRSRRRALRPTARRRGWRRRLCPRPTS